MYRRFFCFLVLFLLVGCQPSSEELYQRAVLDSAVVTSDKIHPLVCLTSTDNQIEWEKDKVILVTWHNVPDKYQSGQTIQNSKEMLWSVSLKELQTKSDSLKTAYDTLRLSQLFGMPPNHSGTHFSVFNVSPKNVLRPAYEWRPDIQQTTVSFNETISDDYKKWFEKNSLDSSGRYPWTRLGYTYDWGSGGQIKYGLTEFVILEGSDITVQKTYTNAQFISYLKESKPGGASSATMSF